MPGFRLGHDSYMPEDGKFQYMDVRTGELKTTNFRDMGYNEAHDALLKVNYDFNNSIQLGVTSKFSRVNVFF